MTLPRHARRFMYQHQKGYSPSNLPTVRFNGRESVHKDGPRPFLACANSCDHNKRAAQNNSSNQHHTHMHSKAIILAAKHLCVAKGCPAKRKRGCNRSTGVQKNVCTLNPDPPVPVSLTKNAENPMVLKTSCTALLLTASLLNDSSLSLNQRISTFLNNKTSDPSQEQCGNDEPCKATNSVGRQRTDVRGSFGLALAKTLVSKSGIKF